jgi:hypothetical protein
MGRRTCRNWREYIGPDGAVMLLLLLALLALVLLDRLRWLLG